MSDLTQSRWIAEQMNDNGIAASPLKVNDAEAIIEGIKAGLGMSLLPIAVADREPGIRRWDGAQPVISRELWLITHPDMRDLARVKAVSSWLISTVRRFTRTSSGIP